MTNARRVLKFLVGLAERVLADPVVRDAIDSVAHEHEWVMRICQSCFHDPQRRWKGKGALYYAFTAELGVCAACGKEHRKADAIAVDFFWKRSK